MWPFNKKEKEANPFTNISDTVAQQQSTITLLAQQELEETSEKIRLGRFHLFIDTLDEPDTSVYSDNVGRYGHMAVDEYISGKESFASVALAKLIEDATKDKDHEDFDHLVMMPSLRAGYLIYIANLEAA